MAKLYFLALLFTIPFTVSVVSILRQLRLWHALSAATLGVTLIFGLWVYRSDWFQQIEWEHEAPQPTEDESRLIDLLSPWIKDTKETALNKCIRVNDPQNWSGLIENLFQANQNMPMVNIRVSPKVFLYNSQYFHPRSPSMGDASLKDGTPQVGDFVRFSAVFQRDPNDCVLFRQGTDDVSDISIGVQFIDIRSH